MNLYILLYGSQEKMTSSNLQFSFTSSPISYKTCALFLPDLVLNLHHLFINTQKDKCLVRFPALISIHLLCLGSFAHRTNPSCSLLPLDPKICIYILVRFCCTACMNIGRMRDTYLRLSVKLRTFPRKPWQKGACS